VELMGGKINVKSELGKGSTFEFDLMVEEGVPAEAAEDLTSQKIIPENVTVLLVEDDKINQLVASNFLKKWRLNVVIANNGAEAIELLKEKKYQLVFMDLNMPVMNGYEATKKIREQKDSYYQQLPIIALTADAVGDVKEKILDFGMNGILNKPFRPTELRKIITDLIPDNLRESEEDNFSEALSFYTEGSAQFKKEFVSLLIQNLLELQSEFKNSIKQNDDQSFRKAVHKITTSVKMLKDGRFEKTVDRAKQLLETTEPNTNVPKSFIEEFDTEVKRMIEKLERS
jgi:CheY-like chemotaxis protein